MKLDNDYNKRVRPLVEKFSKTGVVESNYELTMLIKHYTLLEQLLYVQGDRYYFAWRNAMEERTRLLQMKQARKK